MFAIEIPYDPLLTIPVLPPAGDTPEAVALAGMLIVAIDDEPIQLRAMRQLFGRWGCEVVTGGSTAEALTHLVELQRTPDRSEEHTSELQSLMRISYAVFCLKKKNKHKRLQVIPTYQYLTL